MNEQYQLAKEEHIQEPEEKRGIILKRFMHALEQIPSKDIRNMIYDEVLNLREIDYSITTFKERY